MTILMAYALVADTWGTCIIATTRVVVLAKFILSQRQSREMLVEIHSLMNNFIEDFLKLRN